MFSKIPLSNLRIIKVRGFLFHSAAVYIDDNDDIWARYFNRIHGYLELSFQVNKRKSKIVENDLKMCIILTLNILMIQRMITSDQY